MSPGTSELPWLAPQLRSLRQARAQQRFPHAILVQATTGCGSEALVGFAAQTALCREPDAPCGNCRECQRVSAAAHPDLHWVELEKDANQKVASQIKVQQIRELNAALAMTSHDGGAAVAVINPADAMNASSSNALLKTLEEPRAGVTIILQTALPERLSQTIRSRCLRLRVNPPSRAESLRWLQAQRSDGHWPEVLEVMGNAPLAALQVDARAVSQLRRETFAELERAQAGRLDVIAAAVEWAKPAQFYLRMACVENWITTRIAALLGQKGDAIEVPPKAHLPASGSTMNIAALVRVEDVLRELLRLAETPLNKSLGIEQLLWQVVRIGSDGRG